MTPKKILSLWGLKWNPFSPDLPTDALLVTGKIDAFAWRVEQLVQEGGFAMITGESGSPDDLESRVLALLADRQARTRAKLRDTLSVQNERLGRVLVSLEQAGRIHRTTAGWQAVS